MHKLFKLGVSILLIVVVGASTTVRPLPVKATASSDWLTPAPLSLHKLADVTSIPPSINGNVDCVQKDSSECVINTLFGAAAPNSRVKLNNTSIYRTVVNQINNLPRTLPIPNSGSIISYSNEPPYGFYLSFNKNFSSSIEPFTPLASTESQYRITRPPDGRLADRNNQRLAADSGSISFSRDGKWMVATQPNVGALRVNLQTYEVLPFGVSLNYTLGIAPAPKTAITNDGRFAIITSKDFSVFRIYDLSTCAAVPATITGPVACQSRDLQNYVRNQISGFIAATRIRFIDNTSFSFYASYNNGSGNKTAKFIIKSGAGSLNQIEYLATGDSYISGEGTFNYMQGTDTDNNRCHLSSLSHPYLTGLALSYNSFHSVACSGATIRDIMDASLEYGGQTKIKVKRGERSDTAIREIIDAFRPGNINQLDFIKQKRPRIITISIGGNDIGFSQIVKKCVGPGTCYSSYEDRLELVRHINKRFPDLVGTYLEIKNSSAPDSKIYVIGYPQIAQPGGNCALNVRLNSDELEFSKQLISYLNLVISRAASRAGVMYVNTEAALNGHKMCETTSSNVAVNGLTIGNDFPAFSQGPLGNESYHPNQLGHRLLKRSILASTMNFTQSMPAPNTAVTAPAEIGQEILSAPPSGRVVRLAQYNPDLAEDVVYKSSPTAVALDNAVYPLKPSSPFQLTLHSDPISLGTFNTSSSGSLSFQFQIPADVLPGFHELRLSGLNMAGETVDIYKIVYVGSSSADLNGDGTLNSSDQCTGTDPSGTDIDQDGTDDACDGAIGEAPLVPASSSSTSSGESGHLSSSSSTPVATEESRDNFTKIAYPRESQNEDVLSQTWPKEPAHQEDPAGRFAWATGLLIVATVGLAGSFIVRRR